MIVEEILKNVSEEINSMISTKTVIGEHISIEGKTIIPVTKVSFGFGSGGGEGKTKEGEGGSGGGGGGGASIQPVAFLVVSKEGVQLLTVKGKGAIQELADVLPDIMEIYRSGEKGEKQEETSTVDVD